MSRPDPRRISREAPAGALDVPTLALFAVMVVGLALNAWMAAAEWIPLPAVTLLSILLLNCSFTVWHEAVHATLARSRTVNDGIGMIAAWLSMTPYFRIREVHRRHHRHTNDPERDPDYWFIAGPFWALPLRYLGGLRRYARVSLPPSERAADMAAYVVLAGVLALAWWSGYGHVAVAAWIVPKLVTLVLHAWYVNYLPHRGCTTSQFRTARVVEMAGWLQPFLLFHNYHGLHHAYQTIPWHRYRRAFEARRGFLSAREMPIVRSLRTGGERP